MTAVAEKPDVKREYKMPAVKIGEQVLWYPTLDRGGPGAPAVVTGLNLDTRRADLTVFTRHGGRSILKDGVKHYLDPDCARDNPEGMDERDKPGCWDVGVHRVQAQALEAMRINLNDLSDRLAKAEEASLKLVQRMETLEQLVYEASTNPAQQKK